MKTQRVVALLIPLPPPPGKEGLWLPPAPPTSLVKGGRQGVSERLLLAEVKPSEKERLKNPTFCLKQPDSPQRTDLCLQGQGPQRPCGWLLRRAGTGSVVVGALRAGVARWCPSLEEGCWPGPALRLPWRGPGRLALVAAKPISAGTAYEGAGKPGPGLQPVPSQQMRPVKKALQRSVCRCSEIAFVCCSVTVVTSTWRLSSTSCWPGGRSASGLSAGAQLRGGSSCSAEEVAASALRRW